MKKTLSALLLLVNVIVAIKTCAGPHETIKREPSAYELLETDSAREAYKDSIRDIFRAVSRAIQARQDSLEADSATGPEKAQ